MRIYNIKNTKPLKERVIEAIIRKIYLKVEDKKIVLKEDAILLFLNNVIALAKADFEIDKALTIALNEQKIYKTDPEFKRKELEIDSFEFKIEIEAYKTYLNDLSNRLSEDEFYKNVLSLLNS